MENTSGRKILTNNILWAKFDVDHNNYMVYVEILTETNIKIYFKRNWVGFIFLKKHGLFNNVFFFFQKCIHHLLAQKYHTGICLLDEVGQFTILRLKIYFDVNYN